MTKKKRSALSEEDKKIWQKVTEGITALENNQAPTPLVRKSAFRVAAYDRNSFESTRITPDFRAPSLGLTEQSFSLKDVDHNWQQRLRRGKVKPEGRIDLHGMTQDRAHMALSRYIEEAQYRGKRFILVITGKGGVKSGLSDLSHGEYERGRGILKSNVPQWLSQGQMASRIVSYYSANAEHGGDGALYVILKRLRDG